MDSSVVKAGGRNGGGAEGWAEVGKRGRNGLHL